MQDYTKIVGKCKIENYDKTKYDDYSRMELVYFIQDAKIFYDKICRMLNAGQLDKKLTKDQIYDKLSAAIHEKRNSEQIIKHWQELNKACEQDPNLREDWESFLMVMKLSGYSKDVDG